MELVLIPAGEFMMGSPVSEQGRDDDETEHRVGITKQFYLCQREVTQGQWEAMMGTRPWEGRVGVKDGSDSPATYVSWEEADEFCKRLSERETGARYRLPTEAEWEYACRAGSRGRFSFGESGSELGQYAWFRENADSVNERYAHRVGQKKPNGWWLYDMHGNVWEWCADWYGEYPSGTVRDPTGPSEGLSRVIRGGGWGNLAASCRSASRYADWSPPGDRSAFLGFRVAGSVSGE